MTVLVINGEIYATTLAFLGEQIQSGELKQLGVLQTKNIHENGLETQTVEALLTDDTGDVFAVERHRGIAIVSHVNDEEILALIKAELEAGVPEGEGLVVSQTLQLGTEEYDTSAAQAKVDVEPLRGDEGHTEA